MKPGPRKPGVPARWYQVSSDAAGEVKVDLVDGLLSSVDLVDGTLAGQNVLVSTRAVLVDRESDGRLRGRPTPPLELRDGCLCFDPSKGGIRTRENRRALGAFNGIITEANRFGMINAYVHAERAMSAANRLIREAAGTEAPPLRVVVGAHSGSRLPGYGEGDGDRRSGELRPLSGGHYRLSTRTTGVPELAPVAPTGEIHLGCSRYRKPYAGYESYLRNAAHNPAIIYHEVGHHLCRHTADFRLNAERRPDEQRNGKIGIEEGICDYFAAALLGSGRPYGWYRADRGWRRDPDLSRHVSDLAPDHDSHSEGAVWAAAWWQARSQLVALGLLGSAVDHDRCLIAALLTVGATGTAGQGSRRRRERRRSRRSTMVRAYVEAVRDTGGARAAGEAEQVLEEAGLLSEPASQTVATVPEVAPC